MPLAAMFEFSDLLIIALVIGGLLVAAFIFSQFRSFRKDLADELRREITAAGEAHKVEVQQPLSIKAHVECTPRTDHDQLRKEFQELREQRRSDVHGLHKKIEEGLSGVREDLADEFKEIGCKISDTREELKVNTEKTGNTNSRMANMEHKLDQVLINISRK